MCLFVFVSHPFVTLQYLLSIWLPVCGPPPMIGQAYSAHSGEHFSQGKCGQILQNMDKNGCQGSKNGPLMSYLPNLGPCSSEGSQHVSTIWDTQTRTTESEAVKISVLWDTGKWVKWRPKELLSQPIVAILVSKARCDTKPPSLAIFCFVHGERVSHENTAALLRKKLPLFQFLAFLNQHQIYMYFQWSLHEIQKSIREALGLQVQWYRWFVFSFQSAHNSLYTPNTCSIFTM